MVVLVEVEVGRKRTRRSEVLVSMVEPGQRQTVRCTILRAQCTDKTIKMAQKLYQALNNPDSKSVGREYLQLRSEVEENTLKVKW